MKFSIANEKIENYQQNFKPYQIKTVAVSANGFREGYSQSFLSLIDNGAKNTSISSVLMEDILLKVKDKSGNPLKPIGEVPVIGILGKPQLAPVYILPHLYLGKIHLTDVAVTVPQTSNYGCLIGRSILHQSITTYDPKTDMIHFDFDESLKQDKQNVLNAVAFGDVHLFAEFSA